MTIEREYIIKATFDVTYRVLADSPELAGEYVEQGEGGDFEVQYVNVDAVVLAEAPDADDLRAPIACRACGKPRPAHENGRRCLACILGDRR